MPWDKETKFEYDWPLPLATPQEVKFKDPPKATWEWCVGGDWYSMTFRVPMKKGPNWFHRFMQKWLLGIHWRRIE
jgi:hypothetical protein